MMDPTEDELLALFAATEVTAATDVEGVPLSHVDAQLYADKLAGVSARAGTLALADDLEDVLRDIRKADSFDDLRARLRKRLSKMNRSDLATVVQRVTVLAHSAGKLAVVKVAE